jgi:hypothetical protein
VHDHPGTGISRVSNKRRGPARLEELVARFSADPLVTEGTGFGANRGLRVGGRIFAIFGEQGLTLKLPRARVDELIAAAMGVRFDPGHGRLMREWVTVSARYERDWVGLAEEARRFVGSR